MITKNFRENRIIIETPLTKKYYALYVIRQAKL